MKFIFLLLSFFSSISIVQAQDKTNPLDNKKGDVSLYLSPFALLEYNPTIYIGTEYFLRDKISIYTDLGYIPHMQNFYKIKRKDSNRTVSSFLNASSVNFILKTEFRFYQSSKEQHSRYTGVRFLFKNANYDIENKDEYYTSRRISSSFTLLRGWQEEVGGKFLMNYYVGLGFRLAFNNPSQEIKEDKPLIDLTPAASLSKKQVFPLLDIALGIRFGGKIRRK